MPEGLLGRRRRLCTAAPGYGDDMRPFALRLLSHTLLVGLLAGLLTGLVTAPSPAAAEPDPRWRFYTADQTRYTSPWYAGARRIMIPYGCTRAPYYEPDPRCRRNRGFHHGIDVALPCGTPLYAGRRGVVLSPSSPGRPGSAYGSKAFRIRSSVSGRTVGRTIDIVIGHARRVYVRPGDRVERGQLIARASDAGAPDGCHLHFEVRRKGTGYTGAVNPARYLRLSATDR